MHTPQGANSFCRCCTNRQEAIINTEEVEGSNIYSCGASTVCYSQTVTVNADPISILATPDDGILTLEDVATYFTNSDETLCPITYSFVDAQE